MLVYPSNGSFMVLRRQPARTKSILGILAVLFITILSLPALGGPMSIDGWEQIEPLPQTNTLRDVIWDGGQFVAAGDVGTIMTSPDGRQWTQRVSGTTNNLNAVARNSAKYVAVGGSGTIVVSSDSITWEVQSSGTTRKLNDIAANQTIFVIVGEFGTSLTGSGDGSWANFVGYPIDYYSLIWDGSRFIIGSGPMLYAWNSGSEWTYFAYGGDCVKDVAWNGSKYVAVGYDDCNSPQLPGPPGEFIHSIYSDGNTTYPEYFDSGGLTSVTWTGTQFIVVGMEGDILTNTDNASWVHMYSGVTADLFGVASSDNALVAVGQNGVILLKNMAVAETPPYIVPTLGVAGLMVLASMIALFSILKFGISRTNRSIQNRVVG